MSIHLEITDLINPQQMEVAVRGPDGATHLILCAGLANLSPHDYEMYTFLVGPRLSRRQFVGAVASGAISSIQAAPDPPGLNQRSDLSAHLILIDANFDDQSGRVRVTVEVSTSKTMANLAISYNVSILAELPII